MNQKKSEIPIRDGDNLAVWASEDKLYEGEREGEGEKRTLFKHDGDEIIYAAAFRRLSDKSQVVVKPERTENFRSRLTHTLEVNQIAESLGIELKLNTLLINAMALGHDIGHSPFGHAGERAFQNIIENELVPLCDPDKLRKELKAKYGNDVEIKLTGKWENGHLFFHHAINSVRIIQRKFTGVSKEVIDGIKMHSWSPWQKSHKFGVPLCYEAQVVAIADQIAGINHDTEDILNCEESEHKVDDIYGKLPKYLNEKNILDYTEAKKILEEWFLKKEDISKRNGHGRKYRLRKILNNVVDVSLNKLIRENVESANCAREVPLELDEPVSKFLLGYEKFVREEIIEGVSWFKQRDAQAAAAISTVYNFYKHYRFSKVGMDKIKPLSLRNEIEEAVNTCKDSISDENYSKDECWSIFVNSAEASKKQEVERIIQTIDYVSGMTDRHLMQIHDIAFRLFR